MRASVEFSEGKSIAELVRVVMIVQGIVVVLLSSWIGWEYLNNVYLRQYVQKASLTYLPVIALLATFGAAVSAGEAYVKLKGTNRVEVPTAGYSPSSGIRPRAESGYGLASGLVDSSIVSPTWMKGDGLIADSGGSQSGISFAQVFSESRPPVLLKHVEAPEVKDHYALRPFPVVRRLEPAVEPVEEDGPKVTPRVLNRIGPPQAMLVPLPPVLRQIGSDKGAGAESEEKPSRGRNRRFPKKLEAEEACEGE